MRALPLAPAEAFVLALVDGTTSEAEIASSTGLSPEAVSGTIARLVELGAVVMEARPEPERRNVPRAQGRSAMSGQFALGAVEERVVRIEHPGAALYDESELDEVVDLDLARKRQILDLFYRLGSLNHYEVLGVSPSADWRAVKARYHEVIAVFHPDRYYGKNLGRFKGKLERLFQRMTDAHDTLTRPEARADYDSYLNIGRSTQALEKQLNDEEAYARELHAVQARIEAEAQRAANTPAPSPAHSSAPPTGPSSIPAARPSFLPSGPPSDPARISVGRPDADARRRALARKLGLSSPPPAEIRPSPTPPATPTTPAIHERAANDLKRRYEQRMSEARRRQVHEYLSRAEVSMSEQKVVEAVNALRIAVSLAPDDPLLRQRLDDLQGEANKQLASRYLEQAEYEERDRRWAEAARSYARALSGAPSARLHDRVAFCLLAAQGDVKSAVENARKAVLMAPNDTPFRLTLARAYLAAGMRESGIGELERASAIAPSDDTIKETLRRARRGEI
ncbi:MAG: DnaJ domain-containing protein [Polyangiaceae bacterium]